MKSNEWNREIDVCRMPLWYTCVTYTYNVNVWHTHVFDKHKILSWVLSSCGVATIIRLASMSGLFQKSKDYYWGLWDPFPIVIHVYQTIHTLLATILVGDQSVDTVQVSSVTPASPAASPPNICVVNMQINVEEGILLLTLLPGRTLSHKSTGFTYNSPFFSSKQETRTWDTLPVNLLRILTKKTCICIKWKSCSWSLWCLSGQHVKFCNKMMSLQALDPGNWWNLEILVHGNRTRDSVVETRLLNLSATDALH